MGAAESIDRAALGSLLGRRVEDSVSAASGVRGVSPPAHAHAQRYPIVVLVQSRGTSET